MATPPIAQMLRPVFAAHPNVRLALVFGSVARERARHDSDVDVAVLADQPLTADEKISLIGDIAQATGRAVDLVDLAKVGEPLLGEILAHGRRVIGSDTDQARILVRHLFDEADFSPYQDRILAERRQAWIGE